MKMSVKMQKLLDIKDGFQAELLLREREVEALRNKIKGLDAAIAAYSGVEIATDPRRTNRRNVKRTVMEIISEAGRSGVNAQHVIEHAARSGRQLDKASVSSLLSRLKREGVLRFDGERYYQVGLKEDGPINLKVVTA